MHLNGVFEFYAKMAPMVDIFIYHGGPMFGPHMAYVGGGVLPLRHVDVDRVCFMNICNIVEDESRYKDKGRIHYKFDDDSNEYIHGLNMNHDMIKMLNEFLEGGSMMLINQSLLRCCLQLCF
jgi:hypothetical protein